MASERQPGADQPAVAEPSPAEREPAADRERQPAAQREAAAGSEQAAEREAAVGEPVVQAGDAEAVEDPAAVAAELEDRWRRALADLDNLRKRYARELDRERSAERAMVAASWLPVLDNLERALEHTDGEPDRLVEGLRSVRDQAVSVLSALGYPRHDEVGMPFDPSRHEAVSVVEDPEAAPGTVVRVLRPGYGEGERQLRPAAVAVAGRRE